MVANRLEIAAPSVPRARGYRLRVRKKPHPAYIEVTEDQLETEWVEE